MRAKRRRCHRYRLQLDYVDLYLIHQPFGDVYGEWRAMEELFRAGRVRAIGVATFQPDRLMDLMLHNTTKPAINQIEVNPFLQQRDTQQFLQANGVQTEAWAPFAEGRNQIFENPTLRSLATRHQRRGPGQGQFVFRSMFDTPLRVP